LIGNITYSDLVGSVDIRVSFKAIVGDLFLSDQMRWNQSEKLAAPAPLNSRICPPVNYHHEVAASVDADSEFSEK